MLIISSKQIGRVEISVLLGFHECFKNLLKISCWWWSLSCPHGRWCPRLLGSNYNRLPACWHFSADILLSICPSTQAAHMLCTRHVGSLPRKCPLSSILCVSSSQSQPEWVCLSTLPSYLWPNWTAKYQNWGRSWAEVNGWLDGPAPSFHLKNSFSVFLKDGHLVGALESAVSSPPSLVSWENCLDKTKPQSTPPAELMLHEPFGLSCRYEVAAGGTVVLFVYKVES